MPNSISTIERSTEDTNLIHDDLKASFPYLAIHPDVLETLAKWQEWYVGELSDEIDPATYDSFSVSPVEELYSRTERNETGLLPVGIFYVDDIETNISVKTSGEPGLYIWRRDGRSRPQLVGTTFSDILNRLINAPDDVQRVLHQLNT